MSKPTRTGAPGERHQRVAADVALEVDREIVASRPPATRRASRRRSTPPRRRAPATAHRASRRDRCRADIARRPRSSCRRRDRSPPRAPCARTASMAARRHQQIADPLEPQQQDALRRRAARRPGTSRRNGRQRRQREIGHADRQPLARIEDLQVGEHSRAANAIEWRGYRPRPTFCAIASLPTSTSYFRSPTALPRGRPSRRDRDRRGRR